jgi:hypothetical protein
MKKALRNIEITKNTVQIALAVDQRFAAAFSWDIVC